MEKNTETKVTAAADILAETKVATPVKRVAPKKSAVKKVEKQPVEKQPAEKTEKKAASKKAEKKPAEKQPKEKPLTLRQEAEKLTARIKFDAPLQVRMYQEADNVADKERDISREDLQKNPFAISAPRYLTCQNMIVGLSLTPVSASDKSRRNSIWECNVTRTGATIMIGDTLYSVAKKVLKESEYTYKKQNGWDLKNCLSMTRDKAVEVLNKLNVAYAKLIAAPTK